MSFLWRKEYNINIEEIDNQHKELFKIGRKMYQSIMKEQRAEKEFVEQVMKELKEYVAFHFKSEEEFMRANKYIHYKSHKNEHNFFQKQIERLEGKVGTAFHDNILKEIFDFVFTWILNHILKEDMKLKRLPIRNVQ